MERETRRGTHSRFLELLSPGEARAYLDAFDRWLTGANPDATDQDYYWRSVLTNAFFPDPPRELADLERAVALNPGNVDLWVSLGHQAIGQGRWDKAIACYEAGIEAAPGNFFPWYGRALASMGLGHFEQALRDIDVAIGIHPQLACGYETRGRIYDAMGDPERAVADLDQALRCDEARPATRQLRDRLRSNLQRQDASGRDRPG